MRRVITIAGSRKRTWTIPRTQNVLSRPHKHRTQVPESTNGSNLRFLFVADIGDLLLSTTRALISIEAAELSKVQGVEVGVVHHHDPHMNPHGRFSEGPAIQKIPSHK